ncbi:MAG: DUF2141 domain-containing protein [Flavobacteriaceae bacterium]|nr:DUF2141 domain-containing protein [Flavobacteriaceae bacterium]
MVRILVTIVIYIFTLVGYAQVTNISELNNYEEKTFNIDVVINKVSSDKGKIYFGLYDSQSNFNSRESLKRANVIIKDGSASVTFENLKPGTYVINCFHDANNNGKMDFESNGMPLEDYGMTNNIMSFGPPQFIDGKFELKDKDLTFEIKF